MEQKSFFHKKVQRPTDEQFKQIAEKFGFHFSQEEAKNYQSHVDAALTNYDTLNLLQDDLPQIKYPRTPGYFPAPLENKLNAWYVKSKIQGASTGKLAGKNIVLKDCVCLAGVPMMAGSNILEGYVPDVDATIVTRILDAGGTILGKSVCEDLCTSGTSYTSSKGPVHNPHKFDHVTGGSSSGTAALVGSGEVEMGIGSDQGGSIRIPSSWSGCYGMKPTHGLVPYTGIASMEPTLDHCGPMTGNVSDNALLLEVIAGPDDELDPRQRILENFQGDYTSKLKEGVKGMKIGILKEGFGRPESEMKVDENVRFAAKKFKELGGIVEEISVPEHLTAPIIFNGIFFEGMLKTTLLGNSVGSGFKGLYVTSLMKAASQWQSNADQLSTTTKFPAMIAGFISQEYNGTFYAKAQNLSRKLRKAYDEKLKEYDLLILPTTPFVAPQIPPEDVTFDDYLKGAFAMIANTCAFNCTGHPAFSMPVAKVDDLPVGMMLVSKHYNEEVIYKAAYAWEQAYNWKETPLPN